jgi:hypothetical protein
MALQDLKDALENIDDQILDLTSSPKPSYSINGQSISWSEHMSNLLKARADIQALVISDEPYEERTVAI